jgi:hypothetical protein
MSSLVLNKYVSIEQDSQKRIGYIDKNCADILAPRHSDLISLF